MVIRGIDGNLYWQDLDTGDVVPYIGQDEGTTTPAVGNAAADTGKAT